MADWMLVDLNDINKPLEERDPSASGVSLQLFVSPYDVPQAVQGKYETAIKRFIIDFKYVNSAEEEFVKKPGNANIEFIVGKESNRLYGISVDVDAIGATQVNLNVSAAIDSLATNTPRRMGNYTAAKRALQQTHNRLESIYKERLLQEH
jgi:hypothetical protein